MTAPGSQPDVSIIVIAHNVCEEVLVCLDCIKRNAGRVTVETIVVDQGSTDDTAEAVSSGHPDVRLIAVARNEGLRGRNYGLRAARGRHRMFLDSDARLTPGALATLVDFLDADPGVGLVGPRLVYPDGTLQLSTRRFPPLLLPVLRRPPLGNVFERRRTVRKHLMTDWPHDRVREVEYVLGACMIFSAKAQAAAGEIDSWMFFGPDDADWCFRIRQAGLRVMYCPDATVIHDYRRLSAQRPLSRMASAHLWAFMRFQWKWRRHRRELKRQGRAMDAAG